MPDSQPMPAEQIARRNLALLTDRFEFVASALWESRRRLRNSQRPARYAAVPSKSGNPTCRDTQSGVYLHDPVDPVLEAERSVEQIALTKGSLVLVYRCAFGYLPMDLLRRLTAKSADMRFILHEDRWEVVWEAMTSVDWSPLLSSQHILPMFGDQADEQALGPLEKYPSVTRDGLQVIPGSVMDAEGRSRFETFLSRVESVVSVSRRKLSILKERHTPVQERSRGERIVLYGHAFQDFYPGFKKGLEQNGAEARILDRSKPLGQFVSSELSWLELCEGIPDVATSFNLSGFEPEELRAMGDQGVRRVLWFYDNPQRFDLSPDHLTLADLLLTFDPHHAEWLRSRTGVRVDTLRTATGFSEGCPHVPPPVIEPPKISFVGSSGLRRMQGFASAMENVMKPLRSAIQKLISEWRGRDPVRFHREIEQLPVRSPQLSQATLLRLLEEYTSMLLRLDFLRVAADYGLRVFGDLGWASTEIPGTIPDAYTGHAPDYWKETPWIYTNSHINLNIFHTQCMDAPTVRVYDVLACGGFLLTEYRPCLEEEFAVGEELETFRSPEELREKIVYYLQNDSHRRAIAAKGQIKVLENYTYKHRARDFLRLARSLL